jgi:hypothetical protein
VEPGENKKCYSIFNDRSSNAKSDNVCDTHFKTFHSILVSAMVSFHIFPTANPNNKIKIHETTWSKSKYFTTAEIILCGQNKNQLAVQ